MFVCLSIVQSRRIYWTDFNGIVQNMAYIHGNDRPVFASRSSFIGGSFSDVIIIPIRKQYIRSLNSWCSEGDGGFGQEDEAIVGEG